MATQKLFNVLVLGALTLGACGPQQKLPGDEESPDAAVETADAAELVADAGDVADAGEVAPDAGDEGGSCAWAGMDPCPC